MNKITRIAVIALVALALSVFFIIYVPAVHHPTYIDGAVGDNFPSAFEALAYVASIFFVLPASVGTLVIVFAIKAKQRFIQKRKAKS